tara:strand:- start:50 stop:262 length:213 start_codon:yes stop_codon:yes gene_type:complete
MTFQLGSTTFHSRSDVESDARLLVLDALENECDNGNELLSLLEGFFKYTDVYIGTDTDGSNNYIFSGSNG